MTKHILADGTTLWKYCRIHKLNSGFAYDYIAAGGTPDEAAKYAYDKKYNKKWMYQIGETSLCQYCRQHKYSYTVIRRMVCDLGYTVKDAIEQYTKNRGKAYAKYRLPSGESLRAYCIRNGMDYMAVSGKVRRLKLTPMQAIERYIAMGGKQ